MVKPQLVVLFGILAGAAALVAVTPKSAPTNHNEEWISQRLPNTVGDFAFSGSVEDPTCSYKMSDLTYSTLKASGIVARVYTSGTRQFDVVVIDSNNSDSFHDPRICFQSQGSDLLNQQVHTIETKTRGTVPLMFLETDHNGQQRKAAYTYRGPMGMKTDSNRFILDLFVGELKSAKQQNGTFYRFISLNPETTDDEFRTFIANYLDSLSDSSKTEL